MVNVKFFHKWHKKCSIYVPWLLLLQEVSLVVDDGRQHPERLLGAKGGALVRIVLLE